MRAGDATVMVMAMLACQPATSRPPYPPVPQAASTQVRLPPGEAARLLAEALRADSIPATRVQLRDSWFETRWFDPQSGETTTRRPLGRNVVRVRGWADPTHPGNSLVSVETIYRPVADASLPDRDLDRQVPRDHPVAIKVRAALQELVKRYGGPPAPPPAAGEGVSRPDADEPAPDAADAEEPAPEN